MPIMPTFSLHLGDCLETLKTLPDNSVDSVVCDPPYGLSKEPDMAEVLRHWLAGDDYQHKGAGFMGKTWDSFVPGPAVWKECLRVLKPGGHLLAFFGTRTQDMGTLAIRLAGFEIRDSISWVYGSGFPKSMDVSKAIDKAAGAEREVTRPGVARRDGFGEDWDTGDSATRPRYDNPVTDAARQWQGWGTALKPALEPITVARKPLIGTVAANVLAHGTGSLNIDGCRIGAGGGCKADGCVATASKSQSGAISGYCLASPAVTGLGRWPANLIHDGSDEVVALFPASAGASAPVKGTEASDVTNGIYGKFADRVSGHFYADKGSAARFFYCAKTSKRDRNEGLDDLPDAILARSCQAQAEAARGNTVEEEGGAFNKARVTKNNHPTVKPTDLMAYLCRLVTPPGGTVLDPFMGSGSTGKAAMREGFNFIGCELSEDYLAIARARITHELAKQQVVTDLEQAICDAPAQAGLFVEGAL